MIPHTAHSVFLPKNIPPLFERSAEQRLSLGGSIYFGKKYRRRLRNRKNEKKVRFF